MRNANPAEGNLKPCRTRHKKTLDILPNAYGQGTMFQFCRLAWGPQQLLSQLFGAFKTDNCRYEFFF
jgi:hypothetical protein